MTQKEFIALKAGDTVIYKKLPYVYQGFGNGDFAAIASKGPPIIWKAAHYKKISVETNEIVK